MKNERILDALEKVDEELIMEAAPGNKPPKKAKNKAWMKWGAMAACAVVMVAVGAPQLMNDKGTVSEMEGTNSHVTVVKPEESQGLIAAEHVELGIRIENLNADGISGRIVCGTDVFKEGKSIDVVFLAHTYVVDSGWQILEYDEKSSNIDELELAVGDDVDIFFQAGLYEEAEDGSFSVYAYRVADEGLPNWGLGLSVKDVTDSGLTLVCTQSGGRPTGGPQTGSDYNLMVLEDGTWQEVPTIIEEYAWTAEAYMVPKDDSVEFEINWEWLYGKLPAGTYRIVKGFMDFRKSGDYDSFAYWIEFEIK